jgi:hypothetical protein
MILSMSASMKQLNEFALPALKAPPITVAIISQMSGIPLWARIIVGTVETSSNSITRGFVSSKYALDLRQKLGRCAVDSTVLVVMIWFKSKLIFQ